MGKKLHISESQLKVITKLLVLEGQRLDSLKAKYAQYQKEMDKIVAIKDYSKDFFEFLDDVRESGMVNMYQAADLFWSGSDFIERWVYLNAPHLSGNNQDSWDDDGYDDEVYSEQQEAYQRVLDKADDMRQKIIQVALSKPDVDYDMADTAVKNTARDVLTLWMKHFGTNMGRMKRDVDEVARTLSNARKNKKGSLFPKSAIKANPLRFRPYDRLEESFFFADVENEVICDNCGHTWEKEEDDPHPHLCHMCAYDQKTEDFDVDSVVEFWTNKKED